MSLVDILNSGIGAITALYAFFAIKDIPKKKLSNASWTSMSLIALFTIFFDTLGIGCYAPQTALFKILKLIPDRLIPGTLNTCCILPMCAEAIIYITVIQVDPLTLITVIAAATLGAILGAGIVAKLPEKKIQLGMGIALIIVALFMLAGLFNFMPIGGTAIGLTGAKLAIAIVGSFVLGSLMTIGIGAYAPMMAMVYALGMDPRVSFPIMMGACAFLIPAAGIKFVKEGAYDLKANIIVNTVGLIGVFVAAYIVKSLPLTILEWLICFVVIYTSIIMFRSGLKNKDQNQSVDAPALSK
jgi:uncharacterized membrane protein YfcA